jgi:hypothetical protein
MDSNHQKLKCNKQIINYTHNSGTGCRLFWLGKDFIVAMWELSVGENFQLQF